MVLKKVKGQRIETKTWQTQLVRQGFDFAKTNALFSNVTLFFLLVIADDPDGVDSSDFKRYYEPRFFSDDVPQCFPFDCPQVFRRAALAKAVGLYKSWRSNKQRWDNRVAKRRSSQQSQRGKRRKHKPPTLPTELHLSATLYAGLFKDNTGSSILLRLWTGKAWAWVKFHYDSAGCPQGWTASTPNLVVKSEARSGLTG